MGEKMIRPGLLAIAFVFLSQFANATASEGNPDQSNLSGYAQAALNQAMTSVNNFNDQDARESAKAGVGADKGGIQVNAQTAIAQFQRQYDAANKMVAELNAALTDCTTKADADIAAAQAELTAAQTAKESCSSKGDDPDGGSGSDCSAAEAAIRVAEAKLAQATANKDACIKGISPKIKDGLQAASDVSRAAKAAGFTMEMSHGTSSGVVIKQDPSKASDPKKTYTYTPAKQIDTRSLEFWMNASSSASYPGSSAGIDNLISKLPNSNSQNNQTATHEAGLLNTLMMIGKVGATVWGLHAAPTDASTLNAYSQLRQMQAIEMAQDARGN
jgi:hypothetical protein